MNTTSNVGNRKRKKKRSGSVFKHEKCFGVRKVQKEH